MPCDFGVCVFGRQCVPGDGPMPCPIMLIGEAPGRVELREGRPFVGPAGGLLARLLIEAGLSREEVYITNICGCVDMSREDKRPLPDEIAACAPRLAEEIRLVDPTVILLLGNTALPGWFPGFRIGEVYGDFRAYEGRIVIPTYHVAHVLRGNRQVQPVIVEALKAARRFRDEAHLEEG